MLPLVKVNRFLKITQIARLPYPSPAAKQLQEE